MAHQNPQGNADMEAVREDLYKLQADVNAVLSQLRGSTAESMSAVGKKIRKVGKNAAARGEATIQERPWSSVLVLFLVGLILGWALDRKLST